MGNKTQFWLGLLIGLLASLLIAAVAVLAVPRLRPLVGLDVDEVVNQTTTKNAETNTLPAPSSTESITESDNIRVTAPVANGKISNPVYVQGEARVFENVVELRLSDSDGTVLAQTFTTTRAADIGLFGPFDISLAYQDPQGTVGTLEVFWTSPATGTEIDVVTIPVKF